MPPLSSSTAVLEFLICQRTFALSANFNFCCCRLWEAMVTKTRLLSAVAALITTALVGSPAWGAPCAATSLAGQTTANPITFNLVGGGTATSCSVDGLTSAT
jgi:hypothetical protein